VLTVPASAVIDSGARQTVVVQLAEGRFEPRAVRLGQRGGEFVQVLEGVREGEMVVSSANFLIDAESNLKAALEGMQKADAPAAKPAAVGHRAIGVVNAIDGGGRRDDLARAGRQPAMAGDEDGFRAGESGPGRGLATGGGG
jgi:hypothetical protein